VALFVIVVTLGFTISTRGMLSVDLVLIGLITGYILAFMLGMASFAEVGKEAGFALANPLYFTFELSIVAVIGFSLIAVVSAVVTVGDISEINKASVGREATDQEISSGTYASGLSSRIIHVFGRLPHTSFSKNVSLIAVMGVISQHVVTNGATLSTIISRFPKAGAMNHHDFSRSSWRWGYRDGWYGLLCRRVHTVGCLWEQLEYGGLRRLICCRLGLSTGFSGSSACAVNTQGPGRLWHSPYSFHGDGLNLVLPDEIQSGHLRWLMGVPSLRASP
jgi:hypothetical protein